MNNCKQCGEETTNPSFCNRSCSASYGNIKSPKRKAKEKFCLDCGTSLGKRTQLQYCLPCRRGRRAKSVLPHTTKGELKSKRSHYQSWRSCVSNHARAVLGESGQDKQCIICGYDVYVEVCHINAVNGFPDDAMISEINELSNLIYLCRNHHWGFDNGILDIPDTK